MNTSSHYKQQIIDKLKRPMAKYTVAGKSIIDKPVEIKDVGSGATSLMPTHIKLKTPVPDLTFRCAVHEYDIESSISTDLKELPSNPSRISFCMYRITDCKKRHNVKTPFLQYLLYKYPASDKDYSDMMVFPFTVHRGGSVRRTITEFMSKLGTQKPKIKGFIENLHDLYLFFDLSDTEKLGITAVGLKTKKDSMWWCLIDEICNHKRLMTFPIHPSVYNIFYTNPALIYLKADDKRVEIPIVGYHGNYYKFIPLVASVGQQATSAARFPYGNLYYFGTFRKAIRYGSWSPFYTEKVAYDNKITDIDGKYTKGGMVRFALFLGKTKVLLDEPYDIIDDYLSNKRDWKDKYQSLYIGSIDFDHRKLSANPEYILTEYVQQVSLSYHIIDRDSLKPTWDPHYDGYSII